MKEELLRLPEPFDMHGATDALREIERATTAIKRLTQELANERYALERARAELLSRIGHPVPTETIGGQIISFLQQRPAGAKVAQVREYLETEFGFAGHEKTPGMTLFRLLKNGRVRRQGRVWSYVADSETASVKEQNNGG